ncbi:hypothetical protein NDU88_004107 [Pleurodeles waltl]|uniref:Uncharacterized protein n=1 Tax=Pleurodeles waltl TaxID=8319 RepID=A0AAV7T7U8_PLEWA|nr:hypothetical protein NDU88_004107 [Pleurodeles waltl]
MYVWHVDVEREGLSIGKQQVPVGTSQDCYETQEALEALTSFSEASSQSEGEEENVEQMVGSQVARSEGSSLLDNATTSFQMVLLRDMGRQAAGPHVASVSCASATLSIGQVKELLSLAL